MSKTFVAQLEDENIEFDLNHQSKNEVIIKLDDKEKKLDVQKVANHHYSVLVDGYSYDVSVTRNENHFEVLLLGEKVTFDLLDEKELRKKASLGDAGSEQGGQVVSPMPGKIVKILVEQGQDVSKGQGVIVVEAMKMENEFKANKDGKVKAVHYSVGDSVEGGSVLIELE